MLQQPHIDAVRYSDEYTGADGSKPLELHMQTRWTITQAFYTW
mgnify:CR=1 FL=1|jgi:hypothetical protein